MRIAMTKKILSQKHKTAKVTSITETGFWLHVNDQDYFLSFDRYPWFRYADDEEIKEVKIYPGLEDVPDDDLEDQGDHLRWEYLDIDLGIKSLEYPERFPRSQRFIHCPCNKGSLSSRVIDASEQQKQYEVTTSYTFTGVFKVQADSEEHARKIVEEQCRLNLGGLDVDVLTPFNKIAWDFDEHPDEKIDRVKNLT